MKKALVLVVLACLVIPVQATHYGITTDIYTPALTLQTGDTLFMTDGGFDRLTLFGDSSAEIQGTSALVEGSGGIWTLSLSVDSSLSMSGGEVNLLDLGGDATAVLSGGLIRQIWSSQSAYKLDSGVDPAELVPNPHITIIYSGDLPTVDASNVLTGLWGNGDPFSVYLSDVPESYGYSPAIENIQFELIPEPATLCLLGLGGLLIRRRK